MVECYLCKGKLRVTRDKHVFDEKLKKRYHFKCFAGICRVCDMPVYTKSKHKVIGSNVWHEKCYKTKHRHNPIKTIDEACWKAMETARKAADIPKKLWREFEETYFKKHPPKFVEDKKNPGRPTKEFWAKHYPGILKEAGTKFKSKKRAEEYARGATAQIWHHTMGPEKKAKYEGIRRKREARENPPKDMERFEKELVETLDTTFLIYETGGLPATKSVTLMSMRPVPVAKSTYSIVNTPEHRKILDNLGVKYTVLKISPEHAKLLIKEMLRRDLVRKNPTLVTPELETNIAESFKRVIQGIGTEADRALVRFAREADVVMSTGPSVLLKHNPGETGARFNPEKKGDYIIQDEFGKVYETGTGTEEEAEARALVFNRKYMREFKVIYPKGESAEVKKAAQTATKEMLKS